MIVVLITIAILLFGIFFAFYKKHFEYALIFIKSIFENYYNDREIVISIAKMERCECCEVNE